MLNGALIVAAYLLGSLSTAVVASRALGLPDPRTRGSGNPGATNVLRIGGRGAAAITLLGDMLKGLVAVLAGRLAGVGDGVVAAMGMAAFLGHLYPLFFGFRGGKGVATGLGVLLGISWPAGLAALLTWLAVAAISRYSSLSALCAALLAPAWVALFSHSLPFLIMTILLCALLIWRHRSNIR
ncbi:MAG TPA: glycerol-3-phosphate 1-O-acyltransferase, partial [Gammaproteobacteria bacterium]|nr:glycerol-3-phosphate 1-O-acyltransferase [Gammaproteobacteria bacterium]